MFVKFCKFAPHALKGQKLLAQGNRPGLDNITQIYTNTP